MLENKNLTFNQFVVQLGIILNQFNQIIYEIVILLLIFVFLKKTANNIAIPTIHNTTTSNKTEKDKYNFIYLFVLFSIVIDWYMWGNCFQSLLFAVILILYIMFTVKNQGVMDTFIDYVNIMQDETNRASNIEHDQQYKIMVEKQNQERVNDEIEKLTFYPPDMDPKYMNNIQYFDKTKYKLNEIDGTFESLLPSNTVNDYTKAALEPLYESPQYRNIAKNDIDKYLDDDIHNRKPQKTDHHDFENIALFANPKKQFLDSNWYTAKLPYYNDHCYSNTEQQNDFVKFGYKLENCTNEHNKLLDQTLTQINNNNVSPVLKDFLSI